MRWWGGWAKQYIHREGDDIEQASVCHTCSSVCTHRLSTFFCKASTTSSLSSPSFNLKLASLSTSHSRSVDVPYNLVESDRAGVLGVAG